MKKWPIKVKHNKYSKWYEQLVSNAKNRTLPKDVYTEKHHIVPRSLGGGDDPSNLVILTAREHYVAHLLLWRMDMAPKWHNKMMMALWVMTNGSGYGNQKIDRSKLRLRTSKLYEAFIGERRRITREASTERWKDPEYREHMIEAIKDRWADPEFKEQQRQERKERCGTPEAREAFSIQSTKMWEARSEEERKDILDKSVRKIAQSRKGKTYEEIYTPEQIENLRKGYENRVLTEDSLKRMEQGRLKGAKAPMPEHVKQQVSKRMTGIKRPTIKCTVCGFEGVVANINRWHNENCDPARNKKQRNRRKKRLNT